MFPSLSLSRSAVVILALMLSQAFVAGTSARVPAPVGAGAAAHVARPHAVRFASAPRFVHVWPSYTRYIAAPGSLPLTAAPPASLHFMYGVKAESGAADGPYRTTVTINGLQDVKRMQALNIPILAAHNNTATVVVHSVQLERLAYWHLFPQHTEPVARLVARGSGRLSTSATASQILSASTPGNDPGGLTDQERTWWCLTSPGDATTDSNNNGVSDDTEVQAILDWLQHKRATRPPWGQPFAGWPPNHPSCYDSDYDSIPDAVETFVVGLNPTRESTSGDRYDDGQKLFGVTDCPGSGSGCGYGALPIPDPNGYLSAKLPSWVTAPYDSPFVAALPDPEISVVPGSWHVNRVTTITTQQGQMQQSSASYQTSVTKGTSSSIANTTTWNNWQEVSQAVSRPLSSTSAAQVWTNVRRLGARLSSRSLSSAARLGLLRRIHELSCGTTCQNFVGGVEIVDGLATDVFTHGVDKYVCDGKCTVLDSVGTKLASSVADNGWQILHPDNVQPHNTYSQTTNQNVGSGPDVREAANLALDPAFQSLGSALSGVQYSIAQGDQLLASKLEDVSYAISQPRETDTHTSGQSWGGSQTVTTEQSEEHTVTNGTQFTTGTNWSTATAVDSSHAADPTFNYTITNDGSDYLRELTGLIFNIYLGNDANPIISYDASKDFPAGSGYKLTNMWPAPNGQSSTVTLASHAVPLTLDQMRRIDEGARIRIVQEFVTYGADQSFVNDATGAGISVTTDDGVDGRFHTYVLPTWGTESVQNVLMTFFPAAEDDQGRINDLQTPSYDSSGNVTWRDYPLADNSWWHIYFTQPNDDGAPVRDVPAQAGSSVLIQFDSDSDRDGYTDRVERQYGTDPNNPSSHPSPQILAGTVCTPSGTSVPVGSTIVCKLALQNTGTFPVYGVSAGIYAPDASTTITDNTIGGNGVVAPGFDVAVGSVIEPPDLTNWSTNSDAAEPIVGGNYTGGTDQTYTFTVSQTDAGVVGQGSTAIDWTSTGGGSGSLPLGSTYQSPASIQLSDGLGLSVGFQSGALTSGTSFTVRAISPGDTFSYTVNSASYSTPVVYVSYSDPQGVHRFITHAALANLGDPLAPTYAGTMLTNVGLSLAATGPFNASGTNTTNFVFDSPDPTPITNAKLEIDFVSDGTVVSHTEDVIPTLQPGPTVYPVQWSTSSFSSAYNPNGDNILLATWTDSQGNIIDSTARPFNTFAVDPNPVMNTAPNSWTVGTIIQGAQLQRTVSIVNTGIEPLQFVVSASDPSITLADSKGNAISSPSAIITVPPAGTYPISATLDTSNLATGSLSESLTIRSNDPANGTATIPITGTINAPSTPAYAFDVPNHPWDKLVRVYGNVNQNTAVTFADNVLVDDATAEPCKIYAQGSTTLKGVGKYCSDFGVGTTSYQIFGDGRDGDVTVSSNTDLDPVRAVASGTQGSTTLNVSNVTGMFPTNPPNALVMIHQTQGTGAGQWELNHVASVGSGQITLTKPLANTYTSDSGSDHAQVL